ncbi:MAG: tRNA dihydrouridine synthase DusB [Candidatus Woesearchaeota archaeon]
MKFPKLKGKFVLAPMAGYTDSAFRQLCKDKGAVYVTTEMVSAEAIIRENKKTKDLVYFEEKERPIAIQIFGNNVKNLYNAAKKYQEIFDVIDINLGCPTPKIVKQGSGSSILAKPKMIKKIFSKLSRLDIPITAKIRSGIDENNINAVKISKLLELSGCSAITLHARTVKQGYKGKADWNIIKRIRESVKIPIIGNGDINSPESALKMLNDTNCDYVMIGRAAIGNPFIFKQCNDYFSLGKYNKIKLSEKILELIKYINLAKKYNYPLSRLKIQAQNFVKGIEGNSKIKAELNKVKTVNDIMQILKSIREN